MKAIKWGAIGMGVLFVLLVAALLIIPRFVDVQKLKPEIEKQVTETTGRPFTLGGDLNLSLFPWVGLSFSDLHLGNPPGFKEKDMLALKSFEVRVKLLPLISKEIQVKRFIMKEPRIVLERRKDGRANWEGLGKPADETTIVEKKTKASSPGETGTGLPIASLTVGEFAVTDGYLLWIDRVKGEQKEVSDMTLRMTDVSFDRPIKIALSAMLDGKPLALSGNVGPLGKDPGKGTIPLDLEVKALEQLIMNIKGKMVNPTTQQQFDLAIDVSPFSPRKLMSAMGQEFPVSTADPKALDLVALKAKLAGDPSSVTVSEGDLKLDDSKLFFSAKAGDFSRPDVAFDLNLDRIDLDRYLPPSGDKKGGDEKVEEKPATKKASDQKKTDYTPLRKLILDGTIRIGKLQAKGAKIEDVHLKITGKNGLFNMDPLTLKLYQGDVSSKGALDVRKDTPKSNAELQAKGIQVGPLLKDVLKKDFLEGTTQAKMSIRMSGDEPEMIKRTLNGSGNLLFNDGAVVGIDLAGMVRNAKAAFGLGEKSGEKPRTDFSELNSPFTITNGVVNTPGTILMSPLVRVVAKGTADLVNELLDFRVEPKFVATIKGQGDTQDRSGIMVPVLVTGSFSSPKFMPDLEGIMKDQLKKGIPDASGLEKVVKGEGAPEDQKKTVEETVQGLKKLFPFGN
ncbi:AsmA family protein [Thermodesulfobacteriota bacterium]